MMDNEYPNNEFIRRTANFREELEAFMKTTDDEGNPNPDYTFEDQKKLYEAMMNRAYDLALFIETQESNGYRLVKAEADPVQAVVPDGSPLPTVDDDPFVFDEGVQTHIPTIQDLAEMFDLEYDEESYEVPAWLIDEDLEDEGAIIIGDTPRHPAPEDIPTDGEIDDYERHERTTYTGDGSDYMFGDKNILSGGDSDYEYEDDNNDDWDDDYNDDDYENDYEDDDDETEG